MVGRSNNGHSRVIRSLVYQASFEPSVVSIGLDLQTIDELLEGLTFTIARIPEFYPIVGEDPERWTLSTARYIGNPPLIVWFSYDADHVDLWFVTKAESDEPLDQADRPPPTSN